MTKATLRVGIAVALLLLMPLTVAAQQSAKPPKVGVLFSGFAPVSEPAPLVRAFIDALRKAGWVEGQNVHLEWRYAEGKIDRYPALAAELVALKVDVLVAMSTPAALAAKQATATIPTVAVLVSDPVGSGLVASLARPGGNITGLSLLAPELSAKRLELFKQTLPKLGRAAVLWNTANSGMVLRYRETEAASKSLGVTLDSVGVRSPDEFEQAFATISKHRPDALLVLADTVTVAHRRRAIEFAAANRLPAIYETRDFTDDGGLMSYGINMSEHFRRAAFFVDRVLRGAKPADLPVEQPSTFELIINAKTAKALGLTIPPALLLRADHIIE